MDFADTRQREAFFALHSGLPREGPGDRASVQRALELAGELPDAPEVLDVGCGPGAQTIDLAELLPGSQITALDNHPPFLAELERRAAERGFLDRIRTVEGDMARLPFRAGSFDLIWCEGAAYIIGLDVALASWKPLLRPGGVLALTEPVWLTDDPPPRAAALWAGLRRPSEARNLARGCGYSLLGDFVLPEEAWWTDYYGPLEKRIAEMELSHSADPAASLVLREAREEIDCYRSYSDAYGYLFLVLKV